MEQQAWWRRKEVLSLIAVLFAGVVWTVWAVILSFCPCGVQALLGRLGAVLGTLVGLWGVRMQHPASHRRRLSTALLVLSISSAYFYIPDRLGPLLIGPLNGWIFLVLFSFLLMFIGVILTSVAYVVAYVRGRLLPRWGSIAIAILIIVGILQPFLVGTRVPEIVNTAAAYMLGCLWLGMGYVMWSHRGAATTSQQ